MTEEQKTLGDTIGGDLAQKTAEIERLKAEILADTQSHFGELAKQIFEAFPTLVKFGWTQGTPYFNDGDPCVFSTNELSSVHTTDPDDGDPDEWLFSGMNYSPYNENRISEEKKTEQWYCDRAIFKLFKAIPTEMYEEIFEGNSRVVVTPTEIQISDESY